MKYIRQSFAKRIGMFVLCTCILFSSAFMSYANTMIVKAIDDDFEAFTTVCGMALTVLGVVEIVGSGGSLTPVAAGQIALGLTMSGHELSEYFTDNGDGTYTMSPEFIQLVSDEAARLDAEGFHDFKSIQNASGLYTVKGVSTQYTSGYVTKINGTADFRPFGVGSFDNIIIINQYIGENNWQTLKIPYETFGEGKLKYTGSSHSLGDSHSSSSINIPVFSTNDAALAAFASGDFTTALNYRDKPLFQYGSSYSPVYNGGSVRFSKSVLDGFNDKFQEVNDRIDDVDEKLEELVDYITGGGSGSGGGSGGGLDGTSDSWLERIYNKLCDILAQLKSIKRWTVVNTIINGVDAIADWLDLIHDILSDADSGLESAVSTLSSALDDATGLLKTKFPFSVPWDIFFFVTLLAAEPEVPHFEVPIDFDVSALDMQVHYDFVLDFSDYQYLSDICRVILSMTYAVGLMKLTAGIASTKKEE